MSNHRKAFLLATALGLAMLAAACGPEPLATPDVQATVDASVMATIEARPTATPTRPVTAPHDRPALPPGPIPFDPLLHGLSFANFSGGAGGPPLHIT